MKLGRLSDLRGRVRLCERRRTSFYRKCSAEACDAEEWRDSTVDEFGEDGRLLRRSWVNGDGSSSSMSNEYQGDRLAAVQSAGSSVSRAVYEYDELGRLARIIVRTAGADFSSETYAYDSEGRKTKMLHVDVANQKPNTAYSWGVEGSDTGYSAPGAAMLTTIYNELDQPARLLFHDGAGGLVSRVEFRYDAGGNLLEETQIRELCLPAESLAELNPAQLATMRHALGQTSVKHRYDAHGRRVETCTQMGLLGGDIRTRVYNENGDQIAEVTQYESREFAGIDDEGQLVEAPEKKQADRSEARFLYEYDTHGNWVVKTVESRGGPDQEFMKSTVETRRIEYFG